MDQSVLLPGAMAPRQQVRWAVCLSWLAVVCAVGCTLNPHTDDPSITMSPPPMRGSGGTATAPNGGSSGAEQGTAGGGAPQTSAGGSISVGSGGAPTGASGPG